MSSVTQHTPARAVAFVAVASFAVGAQQVVGLLIIQFGAEDHQIGVATGCVKQTLTLFGDDTTDCLILRSKTSRVGPSDGWCHCYCNL